MWAGAAHHVGDRSGRSAAGGSIQTNPHVPRPRLAEPARGHLAATQNDSAQARPTRSLSERL